MSINRNGDIPKFIPPEERNFLNYFDQLKYEETVKDPDKYFQNVKIIDFGIINHVSRGDPLEKSYKEHLAVKGGDFVKYPGANKKKVTGVLDHFKNK